MNYYILIIGTAEKYDNFADKIMRLFGTLHVYLMNDCQTIEIKNHEIDQDIYDKLGNMLRDLDCTGFIFKADRDQLEQMCAAEVETIPTLSL